MPGLIVALIVGQRLAISVLSPEFASLGVERATGMYALRAAVSTLRTRLPLETLSQSRCTVYRIRTVRARCSAL